MAIDENGNYGYIKEGADTVTPFLSVMYISSEISWYAGYNTDFDSYTRNVTFDFSKHPNFKNLTSSDFLVTLSGAHCNGSHIVANADVCVRAGITNTSYSADTGILTVTYRYNVYGYTVNHKPNGTMYAICLK